MAYNLRLAPKAQKSLNNLFEPDRTRIIAVLDTIIADPFSGKRLAGALKKYHSVRAWPYRIVYQILKKERCILVMRIGRRGDVYR